MKRFFLIIETPDCFQPNTDTVEIHLKGAPAESYIKARITPAINFEDWDDITGDDMTGGDV